MRHKTKEIQIGKVTIGGTNPIAIQSMTNTKTEDVKATVSQILQLEKAGCEIIRCAIPTMEAAKALEEIKKQIHIPLVADIHFDYRLAIAAVEHGADKIRINPGNIGSNERIKAVVDCCKERQVPIRVGVNSGSLEKNLVEKYGGVTAQGLVESALDKVSMITDMGYDNLVISIKSSDVLMCIKAHEELAKQTDFPLHVGITESGTVYSGSIKSAVGLGTILYQGIGDTIRVSLSEAPEAEIPVARKLVDYIMQHQDHPYIPGVEAEGFNYLSPVRRETTAVRNIGGNHLPVVIAERMDGKFDTNPQFIPDYIYAGRALPEIREEGVEYILDADVWEEEPGTYPAFNYQQMPLMGNCQADLKFMFMPYMAQTDEVIACLKAHPEVVIISQSNHPNRLGEHRALVHQLMTEGLQNPVVFFQHYAEDNAEDLQIKSAADMGALIFDGLCDGLFLFNQGSLSHAVVDGIAFGILQAGRLRTSKTEYISCPGCGRTLYDLEKTIARIKAATSHLKGLKIGIMGCIVNGPGEMADADYGYVGAGRGKISLYKGKVCVEKNIPEEEAVERLLEFIRNDRKDIEL